MPVTVAPKPAPPMKTKRQVLEVSTVKQEEFAEPAKALASALGWRGSPDLVGNGVAVRDAERFLQKVLHESHQAGALGNACPASSAACEHLGLTDAADKTAVDAALTVAHESGKGVATTKVEQKTVSLDAKMQGSGAAMAGRMGSK
jgi:hypothetical protein